MELFDCLYNMLCDLLVNWVNWIKTDLPCDVVPERRCIKTVFVRLLPRRERRGDVVSWVKHSLLTAKPEAAAQHRNPTKFLSPTVLSQRIVALKGFSKWMARRLNKPFEIFWSAVQAIWCRIQLCSESPATHQLICIGINKLWPINDSCPNYWISQLAQLSCCMTIISNDYAILFFQTIRHLTCIRLEWPTPLEIWWASRKSTTTKTLSRHIHCMKPSKTEYMYTYIDKPGKTCCFTGIYTSYVLCIGALNHSDKLI